MVTEQEYKKFKSLLEYFVAHLEYVNKGNVSHCGYEKYIKPLVTSQTFKKTGIGYNGQKIQTQIAAWEEYSVGKIAINCTPQYGGNYKTRSCYLNWISTGLNVTAQWNDDHIISLALEIYQRDEDKWTMVVSPVVLSDLGLYDEQPPNNKLKDFLDSFIAMLQKHKQFKLNTEVNADPMITELKDLLLSSKQIILTGAPGTGKTYLAKQVAMAVTGKEENVAFCQFHPSFDYTDFVEGLRPVDKDNGGIGFERRDGIFKAFCKKALKNFLDSLKSQREIKLERSAQEKIDSFLNEAIEKQICLRTATGNEFYIREFDDRRIHIEIPANEIKKGIIAPYAEVQKIISENLILTKPGDIKDIFSRTHHRQHDSYVFVICEEIRKQKNMTNTPVENKVRCENFVFIIDEINRGDISKIFGELFYAVDPGYRGKDGKVTTQYDNLIDETDLYYGGFYIPQNVFIIGTMNDIDRSVESMDFAIRRRFTWKEIEAKDAVGMWDKTIGEHKEKALNAMTGLNEAIENTESLSKAFHIGPAYFLKLKEYNGDLQKLWDLHIMPLLNEYLRGIADAKTALADLRTAYFGTSASETEE